MKPDSPIFASSSSLLLGWFAIVFIGTSSFFECAAQEDSEEESLTRESGNGLVRREILGEELTSLKTYLQGQGIPTTKEGIKNYLRNLVAPKATSSDVNKLIDQLGFYRYSIRAAAEETLAKLSVVPIERLQVATQSANPERAYRAKRVLEKAIPKQLESVNKVHRLISLTKMQGLANEVLAVSELHFKVLGPITGQRTPFKTELKNDLLDSARGALQVTVSEQDMPLLKSVIDSHTSSMRTLAIHALAKGELSKSARVARLLDKIWTEGEPEARLAVAETLLARGERLALDHFVTLLGSPDVKVRAQAEIRLNGATGQSIPFEENGPPEKRRKQVVQWKAWVAEFGEATDIRTDLAFARSRGRTLVSSSLDDSVVEYDLEGNEKWRVNLLNPMECWGTVTGERVVRCWEYDLPNPKYLIVYAPGDGPPRELWSLDYKCRARPLPSGEFLVWGQTNVQRYNRTGKKLWEVDVVWNGKKKYPLAADQLSNGNIRVLFSNVFAAGPQIADTAIEIDENW